jgi:ABC transporter substrate binding protein
VATQFLPASKPGEIETALDTLAQTRPDALLVGPGPFLDSHRNQLIAGAARAAIPAAFETRASALTGGLVSYGADVGDAYRQAGVYAGRVLKGEQPADLPVVRVTKLELVINLKTAKTLGLDLPAKILAVADAVVEFNRRDVAFGPLEDLAVTETSAFEGRADLHPRRDHSPHAQFEFGAGPKRCMLWSGKRC